MGVPDTGDTAWMLASAALVLLMTPGLAFFYGGMVRARGVLNMIMMSISAMGVVTVLWVLYGYSIAFGNDKFDLFGDPTQYFGLKGLVGGNAVEAVIADPEVGIEAVEAVFIPLVGTNLANTWGLGIYIGEALIIDVFTALMLLPLLVYWLKPKYVFGDYRG